VTTFDNLGSDSESLAASVVAENQVHANLARLAAEFGSVSVESSGSTEVSLITMINDIVRPETAAEACLAPTLALFGWAGEGRLIREALPHFDRIENIEALRRVLSLLGYGTTQKRLRQSSIKPHSVPCLFTRDGTDVTLIVDQEPDGTLLVFEGKSSAWNRIEPSSQSGWAFSISDQSVKTEGLQQSASWLFAAIRQFKPTIVATLGLSLLGNLAALALPIFVICVYDLGIGTKSQNIVVMLAIGAGIVVGRWAILVHG
jgi:ATP-binding cassette subfamily C protein LapB